MDPLRFDATMSRGLLTTTIGLGVFLALMAAGMVALFWWMGARTGWPPHLKVMGGVLLPLTVLPMLGAVALTYLYAPSGYVVRADAVVIERPLAPIRLPLAELQQVRRVLPRELAGTIRTMGADGMFARIGRFHSPGLGNFRMYVTDTANAVLLETSERYVISPDEPEAFLRAVTERRSQAASGGPA